MTTGRIRSAGAPEWRAVHVECLSHLHDVAGVGVSGVDDEKHAEEVLPHGAHHAGKGGAQHLSDAARPALVAPVLHQVVDPLSNTQPQHILAYTVHETVRACIIRGKHTDCLIDMYCALTVGVVEIYKRVRRFTT